MKQRSEGNSIGRDQHLVTFEEPGAPVPDGEGGYTESWVPLSPATWYVRVSPMSGRDAEQVLAGTVVTHLTHRVHGRWHPGISTKARMLFAGATYLITSVANIDGRSLEMDLTADLQG
jgi:head-tail adaptor